MDCHSPRIHPESLTGGTLCQTTAFSILDRLADREESLSLSSTFASIGTSMVQTCYGYSAIYIISKLGKIIRIFAVDWQYHFIWQTE